MKRFLIFTMAVALAGKAWSWYSYVFEAKFSGYLTIPVGAARTRR